MAGGLAARRTLDRLAPPLQANSAKAGLARELGYAGELGIEGVESEEVGLSLTRGEQSGEAPVGIGFPRDAPYRLSSLGLMQARLALVALRAQIRAVAVPLPLAGTALELHASRRTPRINCNGEATKIEE